jgi:ferric-dicitrate binding protein FerR (iron transport regulator)
VKWLWSNKEKLQALVERLGRYNENLISLTEDSLSDAMGKRFYHLGLSPDKAANV